MNPRPSGEHKSATATTVDLELMEARILAEIDSRFRATIVWFVGTFLAIAFSAGLLWMRVQVNTTHLEGLDKRLEKVDDRFQRDETIITQHGDLLNDLQKREEQRQIKGKP